MDALSAEISEETGQEVEQITPLTGGCVGEVYRVWLGDGTSVVAKTGQPGDPLDIEGWMLDYLADHSSLPVPKVILARDSLLVMSYIDGEDALSPPSEIHAAELLAALHDVTADDFGLERDTVCGGIHQPNGLYPSWIEFFRDRRLLYMANEAERVGQISSETRIRIDDLATRLAEFIEELDTPSLLHGDVWGGNILVHGDRIAGFVDPAIYYGDPEIELSFATMYATFGEGFFRRYGELRPLRSDYFDIRRDVYNLWPILVHARLFGGGYAKAVDITLTRLGF
jgi:fructosamine-3-kinase